MAVTWKKATLSAADLDEAWRLAKLHQAGNVDEPYPDCKLCNEPMEREPGDAPSAFCSECAYKALDKISLGIPVPSKLREWEVELGFSATRLKELQPIVDALIKEEHYSKWSNELYGLVTAYIRNHCAHDNCGGDTCLDCGMKFVACEACTDPSCMRVVYHEPPACPIEPKE